MKPSIGIISLSIISYDPRVRKQGDLLANAELESCCVRPSGTALIGAVFLRATTFNLTDLCTAPKLKCGPVGATRLSVRWPWGRAQLRTTETYSQAAEALEHMAAFGTNGTNGTNGKQALSHLRRT